MSRWPAAKARRVLAALFQEFEEFHAFTQTALHHAFLGDHFFHDGADCIIEGGHNIAILRAWQFFYLCFDTVHQQNLRIGFVFYRMNL